MQGENRAVRGRYQGELLDDCSRHSIAIRGPLGNQSTSDRNKNRLVVDYFYHAGEFWTAVFPLDGVQQILGQAFNFSKVKTRQGENGPETIVDELGVPKRRIPGLNHLQTRFRLKHDCWVELYALHSEPGGEPLGRVNDFVYSIEAVGPKGIGFGIRDGLRGSLVSAHRFLSTEEMVFERIAVENQYVLESPPLPLTDDQMRRLLQSSLELSDAAKMTEAYYLYRCCGTNNCTSNPLELLDRTVSYRFRQRFGALIYRLPLRPRFYLKVRGMDSDPKHRKLVRTEFADYIAAKETKIRKRAYVKSKIRELREARQSREKGN